MKRIFMVLAVAAVMAMMLVATAAPAFAAGGSGGNKGVGDEAKGLNNPKCETSVDTTTGDEIVLCPPGAGTFHPRPIR